MDRQIIYTHKRGNHFNAHERILGVAAPSWYRTEAQVITEIRAKLNSYFVSVGGRRVNVIIAQHQGRPYIKTEADGYEPNNLLALPEPPPGLLP